MADEEKRNGEETPEEESNEEGLGNLPPLSDFDSQSPLDSDGGLPPLGNFDSDKDDDDSGGLPSINDIEVEEPRPAGGRVQPPPAGMKPKQDEFSSGGFRPMDTPAPVSPGMESPGSFQDLAADSDFSPETPEIGPGPNSNVDTPTFDTAFGGGGFDSPVRTPAPTQAMETPLFGGAQAPGRDQGGFDPGAFGGDFGDFGGGGGTPAPDFSPDTGMSGMGGGGGMQAPMAMPPERGKGGVIAAVLVAILMLVGGLFGGPFIADQDFMSWMPNPTRDKLQAAEQDSMQKQGRINNLQAQIDDLLKVTRVPGEQEISIEALEKLQGDIIEARKNLDEVSTQLQTKQSELDDVTADVAAKTDEFIKKEEQYNQVVTATAITQARRDGLQAEADRLQGMVGSLDAAATRSTASKEALLQNVDELLAKVREGMPLTPAKYAHADRVKAIEDMREQVNNAKWVTPALMDAYNAVVQEEMAIAGAREYFFAKLRVTDRFGTQVEKWSECLMNGNWSVYYRTLDGKNIGVYENLAALDENPIWGVNEGLPSNVQKEIEARVIEHRVEGFEQKVEFLVQKKMAGESETLFQRNFSSL